MSLLGFACALFQPPIDSLQIPGYFAICIRHNDDYSAVVGFPVFSQPEGEPYEKYETMERCVIEL
jgi:hypothetical protein